MSAIDTNVAAIVKKLKENALAYPWTPVGVPPRRHYHIFPNGLQLCFTLDILPGTRYWHLSITRIPGGATQQEIEFWRRAFFDEEPTVEAPTHIAGVSTMNFNWRLK